MNELLLRTSGIIIIGNEILSGRTQDLNSRYLEIGRASCSERV